MIKLPIDTKQELERKRERNFKWYCLAILFLIFGSLAFVIVCSKKYKQVCAEPTEVVSIVENRYRTTYVKLSNGQTVDLYTPTIAPGDYFCAKYKWVEVNPKPYRFLESGRDE